MPDTLSAPTPASLDHPLYYLFNARQMIRWCLHSHRDLLLETETEQLERLLALPDQSQALLIRLVMRKGVFFRTDRLNYAEIGDASVLQRCADSLHQAGFLDTAPEISLNALIHLCRKEEALTLLQQAYPGTGFTRSQSKQTLLAFADKHAPDQLLKLTDWWPRAPFRLLQLQQRELFERLQLMFFGNLQQSLSEFVLAELGIQRYEAVRLDAQSRAFQSRHEVDLYLAMYQLQQQADALPEADATDTQTLLTGLTQQLSALADQHASLRAHSDDGRSGWLKHRYQKLCFRLGRQAEKQAFTELALHCYRQSRNDAAVIRELRLMERHTEPEQVYRRAQTALQHSNKPEQQLLLNRIIQRSGRRAGVETRRRSRKTSRQETVLELPRQEGLRVEQQVIQQLESAGEQAFHCESRLVNGLFGLLFWPVLFQPVPGAFFNPFQSAPADLYRDDFYRRRKPDIEALFQQLEQGDDYKALIRQRFKQKQGISCSLIHWAGLSETVLELSLACIPPRDLSALFRHLLRDLRQHRKGLPDLVVFNRRKQTYRFVEVKGPGDRLQDHQRLWLEQLQRDAIPAEVLYVQWCGL